MATGLIGDLATIHGTTLGNYPNRRLRGWLMFSLLVAALSIDGFSVVTAKGDAEAGKRKAAACAGCHGLDGNSTSPQYPKLAGQHELYLVKALYAYQKGLRKDPLMKPLVAYLSEQDIEDLAAYYAGQTLR